VSLAPSEGPVSPVAITGSSALTPLGDSPAALQAALLARRSAVEPLADLGGAAGASIANFEATRYANVRGLRLYNQPTRLAICAAKLALADSGVEAAGLRKEEVGVILASTFGHMETLVEYDRSLVTVGPQRTNPALMPLAIPSAPGAAIALSFAAKAFSVTLADGGASSFDALGLGAALVRGGRARACIVVGAFSAFRDLALAAARAGLLAPASEYRVFDRRRSGMALCEAAAAVVLERPEDARARGASPKGLLGGQASAFATGPERLAPSLRRACERALGAAGLSADALDLVSAGASGSRRGDAAEAQALAELLGESAGRIPVTAPKANLGDSLDAAGLLQAVAALSAMESGRAPPIIGLEEVEVPGPRYLVEEASLAARHALLTSVSHDGTCSALVLSRPHG